jgi:MFS family permease
VNSTSALERVRRGIALAVLLSMSSTMALIFTVPAPLLYQVGQEYGDWIAQGMSSLPAVGIVLAGPLSAWLNHRFSTRTLLLPALAIYGIAGVAAIFIQEPFALLASRFVLGVAAAIAVSSSVALIASLYEGPTRLKAFGFQGAIASVAGLATLWISGGMASRGTWRSSFELYALAFVLLAVAFVALPRVVRSAQAAPAIASSTLATLGPMWRFYLVVVLVFGASFSTGLQLSFRLGDGGIVDPLAQRNVILFASLANAIGSALFGFIAQRFGTRATFITGVALMGAGALAIGFGQQPLAIGFGSALMGFGAGIAGPSLLGTLTGRVTEAERAGAVALFYSCIFVGEFLNPLFMQSIRSGFGSVAAFNSLGVLLLLGAAWAWSRARRTEAVAG